MRAGGPREALREPDAPGELTQSGRPSSSPAARRRSRRREEGAVAPASAARSSPAHVRVVCARSRGGRPLFASFGLGCRQHCDLTAARSRQLRRRHKVARTGRTAALHRPTRKLFSRKHEAGLGA